MQTASFWYMVPLGMSVATSILIGQALGAGNAQEAKKIIRTAVLLHVCYGIFNGGLFVFALRDYWPKVFTTDQDVLSLAIKCFPIMWLYGFFDATKCLTMAILRGCGRPTVTVFGNFFACLVVALPLSLLFTSRYVNWGLTGLWLGMSLAWCVATICYTIVIIRTDWDQQVAEAQERTSRGMALEKPTAALSEKEHALRLRPLLADNNSIPHSESIIDIGPA
jgi:MATE family multidrug resistance protein